MRRVTMALFAVAFCASAASMTYEASIKRWQEKRDASLRSPDGWLTLVGLFWLKPGPNTIGSADNNDCVLPKNSAPPYVGKIQLQGNRIGFIGENGSEQGMSYDEDRPTVIRAGTVSFYVIKRGDRFAVRAKDADSPVLKKFQGMKYFPINPAFRFDARFIPDRKTIPILNILGETEQEESPGTVEFTYQGHVYRLRPIYEGKTLFFLFKDPTNKTDTYQAGRMLNTPLPVDGKVDLDFNRSYNPPCTFTPYATCPLAPKENTLAFPVQAGEKRYGTGHADYGTP
jgi:uncharacterized protein (DUF1684 family)